MDVAAVTFWPIGRPANGRLKSFASCTTGWIWCAIFRRLLSNGPRAPPAHRLPVDAINTKLIGRSATSRFGEDASSRRTVLMPADRLADEDHVLRGHARHEGIRNIHCWNCGSDL